MSIDEKIQQLDQSTLPETIKTELKRLLTGIEAQLPHLDSYLRHRSQFVMGQLLKEVMDPSGETHWWEAA